MSSVTAAARGRPRDRAVDRRILAAAVAEIAAVGVDVFSVSSCARRARVSKSSMYLRWSNAEELIVDALASVATWPSVPDLGSLEAELEALVSGFTPADAWVSIQLLMRFAGEAERHPELFQAYQERAVLVGSRNVTEVFARARVRGELPPKLEPAAMALAFTGALGIASQLAQTSGHGLPTSAREIIDSFLAFTVPISERKPLDADRDAKPSRRRSRLRGELK